MSQNGTAFRAVLLAAGVGLATVATASVANAACTPAAANGVTATCSGATNNQNGTAGYGTGGEMGVTVDVVAGAGNTVTGSAYGILLGDATVTNNAGATISGVAGAGIAANTDSVNVTNSGTISGTNIFSAYGIIAIFNATVTNNVGASIIGAGIITGGYGIYANDFANVTNSGSIAGTTSDGIFAATNATVTNNASGSITGGLYGIVADTGFANVTNSGSITGTTSDGIYANTDVTVTNNAGGSITGGQVGVAAVNGAANVTNSGSITGTANFGIYAYTDATVTNNATGIITGGLYGIVANTGFANVTNSGSITGTTSDGIFAATNATVTNNAGASITGGVYGIRAVAGGSSVFNAGSISGGTGAIQFAGTSNTLTLAPGSAITGNVLGTGSDTFQLGGTGSATFDVSQIGAAAQYRGFGTFNKIDSSIWTLTGTSTFAGPINVNGGTLSVNGNITSSSGVTVNSGSTLAGTGTVGNTTVSSGGTLAPGNSIGTLNVSGNLTFNTGSFYTVEVSPTAADRTNVTGTAILTGATVQAVALTGSFRSQTYTILNATSGFGGTQFAGITGSSFAPGARNPHLTYDLNNVYLVLDPGTIQLPAGTSGNQAGAAGAINNAVINGATPPAGFDTLLNMTGPQLTNALSQASGQPGASTSQTGIGATGQFINGVFDGAFGNDAGQGGAMGFAAADDDEANAYAAKRKVSREAKDAYAAVTPRDRVAPSFESRWNVWALVYGGNSRVNGDASNGTSTTTSRMFGTVAGASYRFTPDTQAGFALGGAGSNFSLDGGFGGGKADVFNAAVYAKHNWGAAYVAGLLGYSWQDTTTDRTVTISGTDRLHASFKAQALAARLEGGWRYATPMVGVTPYAALQSTSFYLPSYGETATSGSNTFALSYASKTVTATRGELGAKFDKAMLVQGGVFTLKAKTAWAHDWNTDRSATATFQTLPGATFTTSGATPSANAALVSLGAEMGWHNGWTLAGSLDGEFSRTTVAYAGKGSVKYAW